MIQSNADAISYRLKQAKHKYEVAKLLFENEEWNESVSLLYYTCFHAISALLLKSNIVTKTHSGARTQFSKLYIQTNILSQNYGNLLAELFDARQTGNMEILRTLTKKVLSHTLVL